MSQVGHGAFRVADLCILYHTYGVMSHLEYVVLRVADLLQYVAVCHACCRSVAVSCSVPRVLQICCSVLQCATRVADLLQCVAVCHVCCRFLAECHAYGVMSHVEIRHVTCCRLVAVCHTCRVMSRLEYVSYLLQACCSISRVWSHAPCNRRHVPVELISPDSVTSK